MRNLKKFLALVLAMMMVMGLMVTASATSYTDDGKINDVNREAIEVLSAIKVFEGDGGTFNPKGDIRRAEFAIVLYKLAMGDVDQKNAMLNALDDQFSDVDSKDSHKFSWAAPYINYAAFKDWFEGDSGVGGTFRPGDSISYYEVLVSVLRVLGKGDEIGNNWKFDTAELATKMGLTDGINSLVGNATREDVAQMAFNALIYTEEKGVIYHVEASGGGLLYEGPNEYLAIAATTANAGAVTTWAADLTGSLADVNFNGLHEAPAPGADQFMRPLTKWVDKDNVTVVSIPWKANYSWDGTFTGPDSLTIENVSRQNFSIYYNGVAVNKNDAWRSYTPDATAGEAGMWNGSNQRTAAAIPGLEVSAYNMGDGSGWRIVVREAYVGQVTTAKNSSGDVTLAVYEISGSEITTGSANVAYTLKTAKVTDTSYYTAAYNLLSTYSRGSMAAVYVKPGWGNSGDNEDILEVAPLTAVPTTISRIDDNGYIFNSTLSTANGTYKLNNAALWTNYRDSNSVATIQNPNFNRGTNPDSRNIKVGTATLYTMSNNNVLFVDQYRAGSAATTGYGYLFDVQDSTGWLTEQGTMYTAKLYLPDGQMHVVTAQLWDDASKGYVPTQTASFGNLTPVSGSAKSSRDFNTQKGGVFVYYWLTKDARGNEYYMLCAADQNGMETSGGSLMQKYKSSNVVEINKGVAKGRITDTSTGNVTPTDLVFDNGTTFYVITGQPNYETVTVYNGISSLPGNYEAVSASNWSNGVGAIAVGYRTGMGGATTVVQAMVLREPSGSAGLNNSYFIVGGGLPTYVTVRIDASTEYNYRQYNAVVNGGITKVLVTDEIDRYDPDATQSQIWATGSVKLDPTALKGNANVFMTDVTTGQINDSTFKTITNLNTKDVKNGTIILDNKIEGYLIKNDLKVFQYSTNDGSLKEISISEVKDSWKGYFTLNLSGDLTALYVMNT